MNSVVIINSPITTIKVSSPSGIEGVPLYSNSLSLPDYGLISYHKENNQNSIRREVACLRRCLGKRALNAHEFAVVPTPNGWALMVNCRDFKDRALWFAGMIKAESRRWQWGGSRRGNKQKAAAKILLSQ